MAKAKDDDPRFAIHHVETTHKDRWIPDPELGMVKRREPILHRSGVHRLVHDGEVYDIQKDGTFLVPPEVAEFLTRQPNWYEGANPFKPDEVAPVPETAAPA